MPTATTRPPAARAALIAAAACGGDLAAFGMHAVLRDVVGAHRQEGAGADMQRDGDALDAALLQRLEQRRREMQPGGRRRDRAVVGGEDGLVVAASSGSGPAGRAM